MKGSVAALVKGPAASPTSQSHHPGDNTAVLALPPHAKAFFSSEKGLSNE